MKARFISGWLVVVMLAMVFWSGAGPARAATIILKSDADTLGASLGSENSIDDAAKARLDAGDITGLSFSAVIVDGLGSHTPIPSEAPADTMLINLPGGDGENGFFKVTFTLPGGFASASLSGRANADDCGRLFLNGHALTPSIYDAWNYNGIWQSGDYYFATSNQAYFRSGENVIVLADADFFGGGPSAAAFYVNIDYQPVPVPGAVWLLGSGLMGLAGLRRRFRRS